MLNQIKELICGKKVLILGLGREGNSTLRFIQRAGGYESLSVADLNPVSGLDETIEVITGADYQKNLDAFDVVFKSPGIVLEKDFSLYHCYITSQTEQFLKAYRMQTIGITGTKGKSTTTSLLYHVLRDNGKDAVLMGNIGIPCFDCYEKMSEHAIAVFEMSSHQLEFTRVSPHTAVLLNVHEEHLDHYGTFEKYKAAKCNIFRYQEAEDDLFINLENVSETKCCVGQGDSIRSTYAVRSNIHTVCFTGMSLSHEEQEVCLDPTSAEIQIDALHATITGEFETLEIPVADIQLLGHHNYFNIGVSYAIASKFGITSQDFAKSLTSFEPLPHRLKYIGTLQGVKYYDDSISTICETTIQALESVENVGTLLIGGMDRGIDYAPLIHYLVEHPVEHVICMYATGKRIYDALPQERKTTNFYLVEDLKEAVALAKEVTSQNSACLLSPAAASYGYFKNFEDRGDRFKELVFEGNCSEPCDFKYK